jgi:hypothetical protein
MQKLLKPNSDFRSFDKLVGTWKLSGDVEGQIKFEWAEGRFFLIQHVDLKSPQKYGGRRIQGIEIIGHLQRVNEEPTSEIKSRFYSYLDGLTLDYTYELVGDAFTIWFGERGSDDFL